MMEAEMREFAYLAVRLFAIAYNATNLTWFHLYIALSVLPISIC
jgi:hypothetical protein